MVQGCEGVGDIPGVQGVHVTFELNIRLDLSREATTKLLCPL